MAEGGFAARRDFAKALRRLRLAKNFSEAAVARIVGVAEDDIDSWESGGVLPSSEQAESLACALACPAPNVASFQIRQRYSRAVQESDEAERSSIFLSYRRVDEAAFAGRLYDKLLARFGERRVFMDVDSIEVGLDFVEVVEEALAACRVVLVVIGRNWLDAGDQDGNRRLDDTTDFVRIEVETALKRQVPVIPILIEGARMPRAADLPEALSPLVRRNACQMTNARFGSDSFELISTLEKILAMS